MPGARDHIGIVAFERAIHIIGARLNTFEYNTDLHHVYLADRDTWQERSPMPTPRHSVGAATIGDWIYVAGWGAVTGGAVQSAVNEAFGV